MAVTGWIEIDYPVTDAVISAARINTIETVILHANDVRQSYQATRHETRAGYLSETVHIHTLDLIDVATPAIIRPGIGLDDEGASRADNVREMLRSALRGSVLSLTTVGDHYRYRVPRGIDAKISGASAGLVPDSIYPRFSLSFQLVQHNFPNSDRL